MNSSSKYSLKIDMYINSKLSVNLTVVFIEAAAVLCLPNKTS